jgi:Protein of unknown function (DUF2971)
MRLFRYRNLGPLAFKELLYREVYLASPAELNDPLDLNAQIDFRPRNRKELALLGAFLQREAAGAHSQIELIPKLGSLFSQENFESRFEDKDGSLQEGYLSEAGLFGILSLSYRDFFKEQSLFNRIDVEQLHRAVKGICSQVTRNYAVACFSETNDNFLMWSHYAAGHTGVCLEYEFRDSEECVCEFDCETRYLHEGKFLHYPEQIRKVKYLDSLTTLSFFDFLEVFFNHDDIDLIHLSKSRWHYYAELISQQYLQKLHPWCTEQEWRIISPSFKETFPEERVLNYPQESLKGVYFGAKVTEENKLRVQNVTRYRDDPKYYDAIVDGSRTVKFQAAFE